MLVLVLIKEEEVLSPAAAYEFLTTPFSHQVESFNYALEHDKFLLGDEQGLGKTKQSIDMAVYRKQTEGIKHCLIVCGVNSSKRNWVKEIHTHSNEDALILGTRVGKRGKLYIGGSVETRIEDLEEVLQGGISQYFLITNVETLRNKKVREYLNDLTEAGMIGFTIFDEIHRAKNAESKQGKAIHCIKSKYKVALTGTPLMNNPIDLFNVMKWLDAYEFAFYTFRHRYCEMGGKGGHAIVGYKNLKELRDMFEKIMLRRKKSDVLDLPDKIRQLERVQMTPKQAMIYKDVRECIMANIQQIKLSPNPLAQLIRLRQATGYTGILSDTIQESAKINRLKEMLEEVVANGHKALVFSNWTSMTNVLKRELEEYNPAVITGETKDVDFEKEVFQNDPDCKIAIGTIGVMGTAHTLTEASYVFFVDKPWNFANVEQAEDRAHRIGTTKNVTCITLVCENTIDERIEEIIFNKAELSQGLVEGDNDVIERLNVDTDSLVDQLLS
ncbi:gp594 [Bacillus phage G]|uniref:Gp594 n=1 Tax=Bacillus phage G TaxID=2884420 RepID=G3MAX4_9CAUD|nr:gp594 [Bacillus phage G]AEO93839.1 gp594 [Bacillus phage G]